MNNNPDIIIFKANKGDTSIIINTMDYESKMLDIISSSSYKIIPKKSY